MSIKNLFAILLALALLICMFTTPVSAKNTSDKNYYIEIIIHNEVSSETKTKIEKYFANIEPSEDTVSPYGITCTLFGHKIESTSVSTITHKVNSSAPRCLRKTYNYEACTRCDYETSTLTSTEYIFCCA